MWTIWNGEPMKKEEIRELEQIAAGVREKRDAYGNTERKRVDNLK